MKTLQDVLDSLPSNRRHAILDRADELLAEELTLQQMRQALNLTQEELADRLEIGQESVSRLERRADARISTLRSYVQALGGELTLTVRFPDRPPIELQGIGNADAG